MKLISKCPSNNEINGEVEGTTKEEIIDYIKLAKSAQKSWSAIEIKERIKILTQLYLKLEERKEELALLISKEMGKPIIQSNNEVNSTLKQIKWDLENAEEIMADEITLQNDQEIHKVVYEPRGIICIISPFNYPFSIICQSTIQNLIIGNAVINKPDPSTPLLCKLLEEIFKESELPDNIQKFVLGDKEIGEFLVNQEIDMICFTGSTKTGRHLYKIAADKMIPIVMELGGSAPGIIFEDANLDKIIEGVFKKRFSNTGQLCHALKRLIVDESRIDEVLERLKIIAEKQILGDFNNKEATIGSLANENQYNTTIEQYNDAINKGAKVIYGGNIPKDLEGLYFTPTILTNINNNMRVWKEETFGPILPVVSFNTIDEVIELANDTEYGLGGYIFTEDKEKYEYVSKKIKTGMISCNNTTYSGAHNPFGGTKHSGIGRLRGKWGYKEFCNIKVISYEK